MLRKTAVRIATVNALINQEGKRGKSCEARDIGWTDVGDNVYDSHFDPIDLFGDEPLQELPLISVYTDRESLVSKQQNHTSCFDTDLLLVVEVYVCDESSPEVEKGLDDIEEQVKFLLINDTVFHNLAVITAVESSSVRDAEGSRLGVRRMDFNLKYSQEFAVDICEPDFKHTFKEVIPNG